jgi:hypothetical protein
VAILNFLARDFGLILPGLYLTSGFCSKKTVRQGLTPLTSGFCTLFEVRYPGSFLTSKKALFWNFFLRIFRSPFSRFW